ncbi:MAG: hypothetical protein IJW93_05545 [Clostridia bacterium]|nr:hypothetical protein [Clostridia bacterium]
MKKTISLVLSLILICCLVFALFGCEREETYYWEFEKDYTHVTEIKIVVSPNGEKFELNTCKVIKEIDVSYAAELMDDVEDISMRNHLGSLILPSGLCILFMFDNGEYDVISRIGSSHYKYDEDGMIQGYASWLAADADDFFNVISYYLALD